VVNLSCGSKPADLRALIPADSLVYLESNDLGAVMNAITERPAFREAAKTVPDFSVLNGVKLAVAVTGFETKELPVTDENSVLSFTPHFIAVLETNAWNFQAISFTQDKLGEFINQVYGGEVLLETSDKHDGKYFVWTAKDGRKAFALVQGSIVFFGNDETSIDKCLAVKRGEADSIAKNPKITDGDRLAFGYVSPDGIAQIANIIGVKYGSEASDEPEVQSAVAGILPQLLRNSIREVSWTAAKSEDGIEDKYFVALAPEVNKVFYETMAPSDSSNSFLLKFLPADVQSATLYNFKDPRIAWRSFVAVTQSQLEPLAGKVFFELAGSLFEAYGIEDPELFLSSTGSVLATANCDSEGEQPVVIIRTKDAESTRKSLLRRLKRQGLPGIEGAFDLVSPEDELTTFFEGLGAIDQSGSIDMVFSGDSRCVTAVTKRSNLGNPSSQVSVLNIPGEVTPASITTFANNPNVVSHIANLLSEKKTEISEVNSKSVTQTNFSKQGMERRTVSDFGFIGWIITQFGKDQ
jgi:hypothetical protein